MVLTGKQKAAMLLTTLDVSTVSELLRGFDPKVVEDLAVEISYMDVAGMCNHQEVAAVSQEFYDALHEEPDTKRKNFLDDVLKNTLGQARAQALQDDIQTLLRKRDPFLPVLQAEIPALVKILDSEHPQAVAVVLAELPPKRSSEVLGLLSEGVRVSAVGRMTNVGTMPREARARIADMVSTRLEKQNAVGGAGAAPGGGASGAPGGGTPEDSKRKVAVILRNLEKEQRDQVISSVRKKDKDTAEAIMDMMVLWEDIPEVHDRSTQEGLRGLDEQILALALYKADESIAQKIKSNISARAASMIDEEASLMSTPKKKDVAEARDRVLNRLRDLNRNGELKWQDQEL